MEEKKGWFQQNSRLLLILCTFILSMISVSAKAATYDFDYQENQAGHYLTHGTAAGDTYNYDYGNAPGVEFDSENYVNYDDQAYLKKSVQEVAGNQGLFDVTLDVKGNQTNNAVDLVLVVDFSSSMTGEKLNNALLGLQQFGTELADSLANGSIRIGIVAYNRYVYSTNGFSTDIDYLEQFLRQTAESHSGTFMQKGLLEGERLLLEESRPEAEKLFIHIGDNSANRSYLPVEGATTYPNTGEITDYNGYHTQSYVKDFQTDNSAYHTTSSSSSDPLAIPVSTSVVTDATLGTIVAIKEAGFPMYSVATAPSSRGEYIGRNLATSSGNYLTIDENLVGLGSALTEIANKIDKTISSGTITDPMGAGILLQGAGSFDSDNYQLVGWRKDEQGTWVEAPDLVANVQVAEADQTITVSNLALGENERVTLTYQIRLDTEDSSFQGETWVLCNGRTTLVPEVDGEAVDFPIPSIKAPVVSINVLKKWVNVSAAEIPEQIEYQVQRMTTTSEQGWQISDPLTLSKEDDFQVTLSEVPVNGQQLVLPKYNNQGEDFSYTVTEINVPEDFESTVTNDGETIILTNTKKETEPSTTEPSTTEPSTTEPSTTEPSTTEPSTTEPSTTEPSTTEPSTTEPSTTEPSTTEPSTTEPSTTEPSTTEPSTTEPSKTEPSTTEPSATEPSTTEPSTTEPSTTEPSTTEPSTTEPSTTEPSTTEPSTTEPSTTEPSTTEPSTTESNNDHSSTSQTSQSSDQVGGSVTTTTSSQNNGGVLPQTNEKRAAWLVVLGTIIVSGVLATVFKKK